jgi:hypothetical protein
MATSEHKRQEKLARRTAKRKQKQQGLPSAVGPISRAPSLVTRIERGRLQDQGAGPAGGLRLTSAQLQQLAAAPVHQCLIPEPLFKTGIGNVVFSREIGEGGIAVSVFLVDVYCLGVKDAWIKAMSQESYQAMVRYLGRNASFKKASPECVRKLVENAEAYARDLGFEPHPDHQVSRLIFGDVDAGACSTRFTFGHEGKPLYVSGPRDTQARSRQIVDTLTQRLGPDGFHYLVMLDAPP